MATTHDELRTQARAYIREYSVKDRDALIEIVTEGHSLLLNSLDNVSPEQASWKPDPEEWSILEAMSHIVEVKEGVVKTCRALAFGKQPERPCLEIEEGTVHTVPSGSTSIASTG